MRFMYLLECIDGGYGWGETGQKAHMTAENDEFVKLHIPGGWKFTKLYETTETFYLKHL